MTDAPIQTKSLKLVPFAPEHLRGLIRGYDIFARSFGFPAAEGLRDFFVSNDVSPDYLAPLTAATSADPWTHGFAIVHSGAGIVIGTAGFKGPPGADGIVEIAYAVAPTYQGKGYATEAAHALVAFASKDNRVRTIRAHTLPEMNASTSVLKKCGFQHVGEVTDPEDGLIWRWEKPNDSQAALSK